MGKGETSVSDAVNNEVVTVEPGDTIVVVDPHANPDEPVMTGPMEAGDMLAEGTWFDFFRAGHWNGEQLDDEFMYEMMRNFNPSMRKVKLFIGHNSCFEPEKPTLGSAAALRIDNDGFMQALATGVQPELVEGVNSGRFPDRSLEAYHFPEEGGWTLTGIAFLGASPPAVSALRDFKFESAGNKRTIFMPGAAMREMRAAPKLFFSQGIYQFDRSGKAAADGPKSLNTITNQKGGEEEMEEKKLQEMVDSAVSKALDAYKGSDEHKALQEKAAKVDLLEQENTSLKTDAQKQKLDAKQKRVKEFVAKLLSEKKVTPHVVENLGLEAALLSLDDNEPVKCAGKDVTALDRAEAIVASLCDASKLFEVTSAGDDADKGADAGSADKELDAAKNVKQPLEFSIAGHALKQQEKAA